MSNICDRCGKGNVVGRSQKHGRGVAGKRWKKRAQVTPRIFKANIQTVSVVKDGVKTQVKLCTSCIKKFKKEGLIK